MATLSVQMYQTINISEYGNSWNMFAIQSYLLWLYFKLCTEMYMCFTCIYPYLYVRDIF